MGDELAPLGLTMQYVTAFMARVTGRPWTYVPQTPEQRQAREDAIIAESVARAVAHRQEQARRLSDIGALFAERTFATFKPSAGNRAALDQARAVVESGFVSGCAFYGDPGNGKTHLAAAICNEAIERGYVAICASTVSMLLKIRKGFNDSADREASELRVVEAYARADVVVLDDLGTEEFNRFAARVLYAIVNARYEAKRPLIVTSNSSPEDLLATYTNQRDKYGRPIRDVDPLLGMKIVDRVVEMCGGPSSWVAITDESYRWSA